MCCSSTARPAFDPHTLNRWSERPRFGVVVGTYSSIYVAANVLLAMGISKQDLALPDKEDDGANP